MSLVFKATENLTRVDHIFIIGDKHAAGYRVNRHAFYAQEIFEKSLNLPAFLGTLFDLGHPYPQSSGHMMDIVVVHPFTSSFLSFRKVLQSG